MVATRLSGLLRRLMPLALLALLGACNATLGPPADFASQAVASSVDDGARDAALIEMSGAMISGLRAYPLSTGDNLEVSYHFDARAIEAVYTFAVGDEFDVDFRTQPEYSRPVIVRPDGRISLPGKNGLMAVGRSPEGLAKAIASAYRDTLIDPVVTILMRKFHQPSDDLKELVTRADAGRVKLVAIEPDGKINVPGLAPMQAAGRSVSDVRRALDGAYHHRFGNVSTSVRLASIAPNNSFVFGEVRTPGPVTVTGSRLATQLVAAAGGALTTAALDQVRLIYFDEAHRTCIVSLDLSDVGNPRNDIVVPPNATLYVPSSRLARIARAVDLVARQIFLFNGFNLGLGASYNINPSVVAK